MDDCTIYPETVDRHNNLRLLSQLKLGTWTPTNPSLCTCEQEQIMCGCLQSDVWLRREKAGIMGNETELKHKNIFALTPLLGWQKLEISKYASKIPQGLTLKTVVITLSLCSPPLFTLCSCLCSSFPQPVNWQEAEFSVRSNYSTKNWLLL